MFDPYRPAPSSDPMRPRFAWGAFLVFAWVVFGSAVMMLISNAYPFSGRSGLFALAALGVLLGVVAAFGVRAAHSAQVLRGYPRAIGDWLATAAIPIGLGAAWIGSALVHTSSYLPSYMGRRHRKGKTLFKPEATTGGEWARELPSMTRVPREHRQQLADEWRDNACKEHASVAAFSQLALDLMAVGAPPELVRAAQRDALDEVAHAELCFAIARAIDGRVLSAAPFPEARTQRWLFTQSKSVALSQMAIDALADGVLNEGIAARLLAELARECEEPEMAAMLRTMAADESRHAAHSWEIVEFCLQRGGPVVASALRGALRGLPTEVCCSLPAAARDGAWRTWGVHSAAMEAEAFRKTRRNAERKLRDLLERHARDQRERGVAA